MAVTVLQHSDEITKQIIASLKQSDCNRDQLIAKINRPRTTIFDKIKILKKLQVIEDYKKPTGGQGRPYTFFKLKDKNNEIYYAK